MDHWSRVPRMHQNSFDDCARTQAKHKRVTISEQYLANRATMRTSSANNCLPDYCTTRERQCLSSCTSDDAQQRTIRADQKRSASSTSPTERRLACQPIKIACLTAAPHGSVSACPNPHPTTHTIDQYARTQAKHKRSRWITAIHGRSLV